MNVPFTLAKPELDKTFCAEAEAGRPREPRRPSLGRRHARQSIYNAMPLEGVEALVEFMKDFSASSIG